VRYCHRCRKMTPGDPTFCNFCGSTYDLKLCSRLHPNPRHATVCSQCGSREMSTPQPRIPAALNVPLWFFVRLPRLMFVAFVIGSIGLFLYLAGTDRYVQQLLTLMLLIVVFAVAVWRITPRIVQRLTQAGFRLLRNVLISSRKQHGRKT
jgi:RNA polymerase subunit RPABC4/transcription elongation factor Spt4